MAKPKDTNNYGPSGAAFFGCMFVGVGIAYVIDPKMAGAGWLIGTGVGFLVMAFLRRK